MVCVMKYFTPLLVALLLMTMTATRSIAADKVDDTDAVLVTAYSLVQRGDFVGAGKLLKPMVRDQSSNVVARRYLIYVLLKQGRIEEASEQIHDIAKLGANTSFDYWLYAQTYLGAGQRLSGQLCLTKALAGLNAPMMLNFLKTYAQKVESNSPPKSLTRIDAGNDPKQFPATPIATRAGT